MDALHPSTNEIWIRPCPSCGAKANEHCVDTSIPKGRDSRRADFHQSRINAAIRAKESETAPDADGWMKMASAPRNATWFEGQIADGTVIDMHYAHDRSGEECPPFKGFFTWCRPGDKQSGFIEVFPVKWRELDKA